MGDYWFCHCPYCGCEDLILDKRSSDEGGDVYVCESCLLKFHVEEIKED